MPTNEPYEDLEGECLTATERALLLRLDGLGIDGNDHQTWVPRSVVEDGKNVMKGDDDGFRIARWWLLAQGFSL